MQKFSFVMPLQKSETVNSIDGSEENYLEGVASTLDVDRDTERMSEKALFKMQTDVLTQGVNLYGNHQHDWENTLGSITNAEITPDKQFKVKVLLDDKATNPKIPMLLSKIKRGIRLGLSVGGQVLNTKTEFDKALGKKVTIIDDLELFEISVVGVPSNKYTNLSIPKAIAKCLNLEKEEMYTCRDCGKKATYSEWQERGECPNCGSAGLPKEINPKDKSIKCDCEKAQVEGEGKNRILFCSDCGKQLSYCLRCGGMFHEGDYVLCHNKSHYCDDCAKTLPYSWQKSTELEEPMEDIGKTSFREHQISDGSKVVEVVFPDGTRQVLRNKEGDLKKGVEGYIEHKEGKMYCSECGENILHCDYCGKDFHNVEDVICSDVGGHYCSGECEKEDTE
jgi:phage head maturation protease